MALPVFRCRDPQLWDKTKVLEQSCLVLATTSLGKNRIGVRDSSCRSVCLYILFPVGVDGGGVSIGGTSGGQTKLNSVAVFRKRTIPTKRPPLVGEVSANLCG
jgi:hypothetical protein